MKKTFPLSVNLILLFVCSLLLVGIITGCVKEEAPSGTAEHQSPTLYPVTEVIDGDTIKIKYNGATESVRLIGVNTPETKHPTKGVEPYGPEASAYTKTLLTGKSVRLEFDVQQRDKYSRLLAYVFLPDGTFVNEVLIADGYAQVMTIPPNVKYADHFVELQRQAREAERGLWGHQPVTEGKFVGSSKSGKYHRPDCQWAQKISPGNLIYFANETEAKDQGYVPCKVCNPGS